MKNFFKKIVERKLKKYAERILEKYNPDIIAITGSVGKTSTKEAIYGVLKNHFEVRKSEKNYNNEIGVPLTLIGSDSGGKSPFAWLGIFRKAKKIIRNKCEYPKIIILEMGADHPGDIEYLTSFIKPKIAIVTHVGHSHVEYFKTQKNIAREKGRLIENTRKDGYAVLNFDDPYVLSMAKRTKANVLTYGFSEGSDLRASEVRAGEESKNGIGISFKLAYDKSNVPVILPNILGEHFIYAVLCAIAVSKIYEINIVDTISELKNFEPLPGRMKLLKGIKNTKIIDDTYNSSPQSVIAALKAMALYPSKRKIAVLGDMLELGKISENEHYAIGEKLMDFGIDIAICVGERSRDIARGAKDSGMLPDRIFSFSEIREAGKFLQERMEQGDLVLIKGSQGMRMENIVQEVMAEPQRAREVLCRQSNEWRNRA